ncbi:hypothetical protein MMC09_003459 [Bachmanniomyces sp. S44760]|nr:hypothetical protein [Bachmanniomyces sp. S44760]
MACKFKVAGNPGPESSKRLRRLPVNHFECICPLLNAISHGRSWNNFPEQAAMSVAKRRGRDVEESLNGLTLSPSSHKIKTSDVAPSKSSMKPTDISKPKSKSKSKAPIADSWEEEASSSSDSDTASPIADLKTTNDYPRAPPPTPLSPRNRGWDSFESPYAPIKNTGRGGTVTPPRSNFDPSTRPEKTNAVAGRMIAGALGVRAPKKSDEQRAYEKAVRDKELRRRDAEKENRRRDNEEAERAKSAAWDG